VVTAAVGGTDGEPDVHVLLAQDRGAVPVLIGDLGEGPVDDHDVIGGRVGACPAIAQHAFSCFAGVVEEAEQRVVAERLCTRSA
jgi:hypothetical protein